MMKVVSAARKGKRAVVWNGYEGAEYAAEQPVGSRVPEGAQRDSEVRIYGTEKGENGECSRKRA